MVCWVYIWFVYSSTSTGSAISGSSTLFTSARLAGSAWPVSGTSILSVFVEFTILVPDLFTLSAPIRSIMFVPSSSAPFANARFVKVVSGLSTPSASA